MRLRHSGVAALVAVLLLAASPALATIAVCTARDSDSRWYTSKQTGVFGWQAKAIAERLASFDCRSRSKHPGSCKIVSCRITSP
jgi:hypothetical protein